MTIDIEALLEEIDTDGSGEIEFDEFKALLTGDVDWNKYVCIIEICIFNSKNKIN